MRLHDQGKRLPKTTNGAGYAEMLGQALRQEMGDRRFAAKTVGRWTRASERTIKNWFSGTTLPNAEHLIKLIARSDAALETILAASRRADLLEAFYTLSRRERAAARPQSNLGYVTGRGTNRDTGDGTNRGRQVPARLAARRTWFLAELMAGEAPGLSALRDQFGISARTAKRDVAAMRMEGTIKYEGTTRNGRYVLAVAKNMSGRPFRGER